MDGRRRSFARGATVYDPWHYLPVMTRKPSALRNGAPFRDSASALPATGEVAFQVGATVPVQGRYALGPPKVVLDRTAAPCKWPI